MECTVCYEKANLTTRAMVKCFACEQEACKTCWRRHLTTSKKLPQCMSCGAAFQQNFLVAHFNRSWVNDPEAGLKPVMKEALLQREMAKMPETQPFAEAEKERRRLGKVNAKYAVKMAELQAQIQRYSNAIVANRFRMRGDAVPARYMNELVDGGAVAVDAKKKFVMACPYPECKGFLSTAYKCGLCDRKTCVDCLNVMTKGEEHACVEGDKLTAEMIKKETRPCPTCGERIFKVSGCDQMYCTSVKDGTVCGTAFSWRTGQVETGTIHNPHYYELQRQNGGAVRNVGDVQCGGMPDVRPLLYVLEAVDHAAPTLRMRVRKAHQNLSEHVQYAVPEGRVRLRQMGETRPLRVQFLLGDMTKVELEEGVYRMHKDYTKHLELYHINELLSVSGIEAFIDMCADLPSFKTVAQLVTADSSYAESFAQTFETRFAALDKIREYCNGQLKQVSVSYHCTVPTFNEDYSKTSRRFNMADIEA